MKGEKIMGKIADISKHQGRVDWEQAAKELDLAILRASYGVQSVDERYHDNVKGCLKYGVPFGAYHYVYAGNAEKARQEAKSFVKTTRAEAAEPAFWIADIEYDAQDKDTTDPICAAFLDELRKQGCKKIGLYINTRYKYLKQATIDMCDIMWIPHWGKNDGNVPGDSAKPKYPHDIWQYTSYGTLAGVEGRVDLNMLTGTKPLEYFTGAQEEPEKPAEDEEKAVLYLVTMGAYTSREKAQEAAEKARTLGLNAEVMDVYGDPEDAENAIEAVEIAPSTWNVRKGPGTQFGIIGLAREGEVYEKDEDASTEDWVCILYGGEKGYISAKGVVDK